LQYIREVIDIHSPSTTCRSFYGCFVFFTRNWVSSPSCLESLLVILWMTQSHVATYCL